MMRESNTIGGLLAKARRMLEQAGVENAAQESRWLVAHALELDSHQLASKAEEPVAGERWAHAESLLARRSAHEPLQYILGTQEFCGLEFRVTPAVLIPRPETELLVQEALRVVDAGKEAVLADIGTGSGCIAVTLAAVLGRARIVAVDRCAEALMVAKSNAERHGVAGRIDWIEGDLLAPLRERGWARSVDVIVSNPPYIAENEWPGLQPEIREYEPRSALVGGPQGTEFHERLLREAIEYLVPGGALVMEIGRNQLPAVQQMAERMGRYEPVRAVKDEAGIERVVIVQRRE